jgi:F-type H+-transporting ATPase subunit gamma
MASTESLKQRIENLDDLQQIVRTMKALSAVSIRQYERAAAALAEYEGTVELGLRAALREAPTAVAASRAQGDADSRGAAAAVIVLGTDHGLCGRFNEVIAEHVQERADETRTVRHWLAVG